MLLRQMQTMLAQFYDAPSTHDVYDFLTTDRRFVPASTSTDEQVLIAETADGADVRVFIAADVLARLAANDPWRGLNGENLADYCTAFEGVSHFHYITWCAARGTSVSLLELELQAEVDKYVGAMILLTRQRGGRFPSELHARLFDRVRFAAGLDAESLARYELANRRAAYYCRKLDEQYLRSRCKRPEAWLTELRRFYRCGHAEKLRRAAA